MPKFLAGLAAALLVASFSHGARAQAADDLLPVEQAFAISARVSEPGHVDLHWDIAPDYYLYRSRIKAKMTQAGVTLGELELPAGKPVRDEFFGDVEIYHGAIDARLPYTLADTATASLALTVTVQGCHEVDPLVCYPPHPTTLTLQLPPASAASTAASPDDAPGLLGHSGTSGTSLLGIGTGPGASAGEPLPPAQAFRFEAIVNGPGEILARWTMAPGYYLYRDKSALTLTGADGVRLGAPAWPRGTDHADEYFGQTTVYFDQVEVAVPLARDGGAAQPLTLVAQYQGCEADGICYPVMTQDVPLSLPAVDAEQLAAINAAFVPAAAHDPSMERSKVGIPASPSGARGAFDLSPQPSATDNALRSTPPSPGLGAILVALLLALGGGLVLNLMPCVLPVLSLKVLGLAQGGEDRVRARRHALAYTAGVLVSFAVVGLVVIGLRAAGHALGWGFQLQQPLFVAFLVYVLFAIGLSLSGVFNIGAGLAGVGRDLGNRSGPAGDFFTGVLAVVVASPCTAPFMGTALAFAFSASAWVALLVFLALGLGLALPFLAVAYIPALAARLPRPGAWMETLKQFLAFPMYLTAVWLLWVLGNQRGIDAVAWVLIGATVLALGLWWWEHTRYRGGAVARAVAAVLVLAALVPLAQVTRLAAPAAQAAASADFVPYSAERLASLRAEGRSVFVDMGADWCVTCKVNERAVLETDSFRDLLARTDAVLMKGDWTNVDPAITAFLDEYHAVGVPLYVVFRAGEAGPGRALPTVLTHAIVEQALAGN
ncbi:MAG: protein-disulfide reductase DsbD [Xanthomonadales bacterium]|nr:protein-disulfide reductase DsbD [Xanthomonadales bacterium]